MIRSLCFLATYQCNARCDYCECGPKLRARLSLGDMVGYIDQAAALGTVGQVVFSGGEATLLGDDLFAAIGHAHARGMLTRVVTNGWWGHTPARAGAFLGRLRDAGLTEINISVDDLHQAWIPLERVANCVRACVDGGFKCLVVHKESREPTITKTVLERAFGLALVDFESARTYTADEECRLFVTGPIVPVGREPAAASARPLRAAPCGKSCGSILRDVVIDPWHRFLVCCGIVSKGIPELTLEDLRTSPMIDVIDAANQDLILNWLALEGPASIARFITEHDPAVTFDDRYVGICHLCNDIFTREDSRAVLHANAWRARPRIALHRSFLEAARADEELSSLYVKT
ncbi:MAG: radical SAM protein [Rhodospirillales bacterium]